MSTESRTAIVTGAAQGIGRGIAQRLVQDGLAVTLNDIPGNRETLERTAAEIGREGGTCRTSTGDVSVPADVDRMAAEH
ncbi:SDR family NAD(P)-dependent oxidoreductase, partial [Tropicimonas sp.]|uniref:SDR family NAD(P)-dependent oxidoreductase n=1 Tax=Tropicimonas sp. TaxID=2067044 RepID=UPI003A8AE743